MKKLALVMTLQIAVFALFAQKYDPLHARRPEPVNPMKDKKEYQGYTIRLMPATPGPGMMWSYGFIILKDNKPVAHQFRNPLPFASVGIQEKDDAFKIAQLLIQEYKKTGHWQSRVAPHIAHELKIESPSFIQNN